MAQADELARMAARNASLERQAHLDPLTGVLNRRGLSRRLRAEMAKSLQSGLSLAAIFVDLDDFKAVNEALGHAGGDRVLAAVAARLRDATRQGDALGRVGGDEFVVLLRGVGQTSLGTVSERLRAALAAAPVDVGGGAARRVTLSAAAVVLDRETGRLEEVLAQVREAQRRSKDAGKNRVTLVAPRRGAGHVVRGPWPPQATADDPNPPPELRTEVQERGPGLGGKRLGADAGLRHVELPVSPVSPVSLGDVKPDAGHVHAPKPNPVVGGGVGDEDEHG